MQKVIKDYVPSVELKGKDQKSGQKFDLDSFYNQTTNLNTEDLSKLNKQKAPKEATDDKSYTTTQEESEGGVSDRKREFSPTMDQYEFNLLEKEEEFEINLVLKVSSNDREELSKLEKDEEEAKKEEETKDENEAGDGKNE